MTTTDAHSSISPVPTRTCPGPTLRHVWQIRLSTPSENHLTYHHLSFLNLNLQADEIEQLDDYPALHIEQWVHRDRYVPRYNVAPRTHAPVIRRAQPEQPTLVMHSMKWGLVPHWSKAEPPTLHTINARSENLEEGDGMWGSIKGRKRCVVVAQGCVPLPTFFLSLSRRC
jgi:SOS response associated peptidase (SRAP)